MKNMEKRLTKNKLFVRKNIQNDEKKVEKNLGFCKEKHEKFMQKKSIFCKVKYIGIAKKNSLLP